MTYPLTIIIVDVNVFTICVRFGNIFAVSKKKKWSTTSNFFKKGKRISSVCQFLSLKYDEAVSDTSQIRIFKLHVALTLTQYEM